MRCELVDSRALRATFHCVPNYVLCHPMTPQSPILPNRSEQFSFTYSGRARPTVDSCLHPFRHRNRANVATLPDQIKNGPMLFPLLKVADIQRYQFGPSESASK